MARLIAAGVVAASVAGGRACNGSPDFCQLPLDKATFAGSHNAGSYDLTLPSHIEDDIVVAPIARGLYENHNHNFPQQLDNGVRFFANDVCSDGGGPMYSCHSDARGKVPFTDELTQIKAWLEAHPQEIVIVYPENTQGIRDMDHWLEPFQTVFGPCTDSNMTRTLNSTLKCMPLDMAPSDPDAITLGRLVETGRRLIVGPTGTPISHTWTSAYSGVQLAGLFELLMSYAGALVERNWANVSAASLGRMRYESIHEFKLVRTAAAPTSASNFFSGEWNIGSNRMTAESTNRQYAPGEGDENTNEDRYYTDDTADQCEGTCGCYGYKSQVEAIHQGVLNRGHSIFAIDVDYTEYGDVGGMALRMNQANVRRLNGQLEPGTPATQCGWFIGLMVGLSCFVLGMCIFAACFLRTSESRSNLYALCCCQRGKGGANGSHQRWYDEEAAKDPVPPAQMQPSGGVAPPAGYGAQPYGAQPYGMQPYGAQPACGAQPPYIVQPPPGAQQPYGAHPAAAGQGDFGIAGPQAATSWTVNHRTE